MGFAERRQVVERRMGQLHAGRALSLARHRLNSIESARFDRWFSMARRYPCDYVLAARKRVVM